MPSMPNTPRTWKRNLIILWGLFSIPFLVLAILFILLGKGKLGYVPTFEDLENPSNSLASEIWSSDSVLLSKFYLENRTFIDFTDLSPYIVNALLATEDIRFHRHSGVDARGTARMLVKSVYSKPAGLAQPVAAQGILLGGRSESGWVDN